MRAGDDERIIDFEWPYVKHEENHKSGFQEN